MARDIQITFDCAEPGAQAEFWAAALDYKLEDPPPGFATWDAALAAWGVPPEQRNSKSAIVAPDGSGNRVFFQQVPEGKTAKNRVHLDIRAAPGLVGDERMAALEADAARLIALGATQFARFEPGPREAGFIVMQDPEGNEFCLD
ncbi:MAG: glyoxalase-like protein [Nocardioidaceae bacterium]|nr:glyoxalase-like protein [Nocardioidaceae bacterium]